MLERYETLNCLLWVGEGADIHQQSIEAHASSKGIDFAQGPQRTEGWVLVGSEANLAKDIATLAWQRFQSGLAEYPESLQAIYVRPSDAELKNIVSK